MPPVTNQPASSLDREYPISELGRTENQGRPGIPGLFNTAATAIEEGLLLKTFMLYNIIDSKVDHTAKISHGEGRRGGSSLSSECATQPNTPSRVAESMGYLEPESSDPSALHTAQAVFTSGTAWSDRQTQLLANSPGFIGRYLGFFAPATGTSFSMPQGVSDALYSFGLLRSVTLSNLVAIYY